VTAKILMVDDEPDAEILFRQNFRREMRKQEYDFLFAQSGAEALELLEGSEQPDVLVVLSDINMPGMNGIDLLDEIKKRWPGMPVFMITAYGDSGTEAKVKEKGADQLVPKPVDFQQLKVSLAGITLAAAS
jgi:CheY-like chemotaxis protein